MGVRGGWRSTRRGLAWLLVVPIVAAAARNAAGHTPTGNTQDGIARATLSGDGFQLENALIGVSGSVAGGHLHGLVLKDRGHGTELKVAVPFAILMEDGMVDSAENLRLSGPITKLEHAAQPEASRLADRLHGEQFDVRMESDDHALRVGWSLVLLDGSNYVRQELRITALDRDAAIKRVELIQLIDLPLGGAQVSGVVAGSPIVAGNLFLGIEDPLAQSKVTNGRATAWIDRDLPLRAGQSIAYSAVFGIAREGQMRRDFLAYLERERAHPYRIFLHYNSWYDLGYFTPYDATGAVARVNAFGHELTEKRGVKLDSFLFDDGWDNHKSLWKFNGGFPAGFTRVSEAAKKYGAAPGVWMSPWGGYDGPKKERIEFGRGAGYEIVADGYALSGPKYYDAFRDVAMEMVTKYGVNQFKLDGTGNVDSVFKGSRFDSDFEAAIHLIGELRKARPDVFINLTTGTWPSPFWLMYADSIWRDGEDDGFAGVGSYRERWITYRDEETYRHVVQGGPLYPLNSLMLHGIIYAQHRKHLDEDPGHDFRNEVRSYFGTGTQLQEMYITPSLLSQGNWDDLAEAAKWSRDNAEVLKDTHWIGGDPAWLEVYGWAAWKASDGNAREKGIVVLRNPSDREQTIRVKLQDALELPSGAAQTYGARSPWHEDAGKPELSLKAGEAHAFRLAPFEVITLDVVPRP